MDERTYSITVTFVDGRFLKFKEKSIGKDLFACKIEDEKSVWIDVPNDADNSINTVRKTNILGVKYKDITDKHITKIKTESVPL